MVEVVVGAAVVVVVVVVGTPIRRLLATRNGRLVTTVDACVDTGAAAVVVDVAADAFAFAPPRSRTNLRVGRSLRRAPPFKDGRREAFSTSFFAVAPFFSSSASFRDLNLEFPRLVNLFVVVSILSVLVSVSVVSGGAVAFVRRRKLRFAACGQNQRWMEVEAKIEYQYRLVT